MAVSTAQKVDYLLKKIGYTASKTGLAPDSVLSGTKKQPFAEAVPSPLVIASSCLWADSTYIPATPPGSDSDYVKVYLSAASGHRMTVDSTVSGNRAYIAYSTYNNSSTAILGDWIDTQFGASYIIKVYKGDPNSGGVALSAEGSGSNDGWFFDYSSGILNFNDTNVPSGVTDSNIYIVGYRYIGTKGATAAGGISTFTTQYVSGVSTFGGAADFNGGADISGGVGLNVVGHTEVDNVNVSGVSTFAGAVDINGGANLSGGSGVTVAAHLVANSLGVTGVATFAAAIDANAGASITGGEATFASATVSDLTAGRLTYAGTSGALEDSTKLTFLTDKLAVTGGLTVSAGATLSSNLDVDGGADISGGVGLNVVGHTEVDNVNVSGVSTYAGAADFNGSVDISGGSGLNVVGHTEVDNVNVSGASTFAQLVDANAGLDVGGTAGLNVAGVSTFGQLVSASAGVNVAGAAGLNVAGVATFASNVKLGDNDKLIFGAGSDLTILSNGTVGKIQAKDGEESVVLTSDAGVDLYHDNSLRFRTTGIGVTIAGANSGSGVGKTAYLEGPEEIWIDPSPVGVATTSGVVRIRGDLYVDGTEFIVDVEKLEIGDFQIGIASTAGNNTELDGAGIGIGSLAIRKTITWNNATSALMCSENWNVASGKHYEINGTDVLTSTTLGSGVVYSSLTHTGTLEKPVVGAGGITVAGVSTFSQLVDANAGLDVGGVAGLKVAGVSTFTGAIDADGGASITGGTGLTASSVKVSDLTATRLVFAGTAGELEDSSKVTFDKAIDKFAITGGVTVSAGATFSGIVDGNAGADISGGAGLNVVGHSELDNVNVSGVSTYTGAADFNGSVDISGGSGLNVTGHTEVDNFNASGVSTFAALVDGNAGANFSGAETVLSSATVSDLTENRVVIAGVDGALEDASTLTYNGTQFNVGTGITMYQATGIVSATYFYGDGSTLTNAGSTLEAASAVQRVVTTSLTSGTMTSAGTDADLTFDTSSNTLNAGKVNVAGVGTFGGLVDGNAGCNFSGAESTFSSATVSDLTATRVVYAGSAGSLVDSANLTFSGSKLTVTGNAQVTTDLDVDGGANISGGVGLDVVGHTELDNLNVSGIATIANVVLTKNTTGVGATVGGQNIGVVTYYGDGSKLTGTGSDSTGTQRVEVVNTGVILVGVITATEQFSGQITGVGATFTNITGLLATAAQTNITSLGNLTGLTVNGDEEFYGSAGVTSAIWDKSENLLNFKDHTKATFGTGNDLNLYHNGTDSVIDNETGDLYVQGDDQVIIKSVGTTEIRKHAGDEVMIKCTPDESVDIYFNNSKKIETSHTGAIVTGILTATSFTGTLNTAAQTNITSVGTLTGLVVNGDLDLYGSAGVSSAIWDKSENLLNFKDHVKATFGTGNDTTIYHDTDNSYINHTGAGGLNIRMAKDDGVVKVLGNANTDIAKFTDNAGVELYFNNSKKFETSHTGAIVTGIATATGGLSINADSTNLEIGVGNDLQLYHNGTDSYIDNVTGNLILRVNTNEKAFVGVPNGSVELYFDNSKKLQTTYHGLVATGIVTATTFSGSATHAVVADTVDISNATADSSFYPVLATLNAAGQTVYIDGGGELTWNPSTNILGVQGDVEIADKIVHSGDTNTAIRFPSADTFTVETSGTEALRIDSSGRVLINDAGTATNTPMETFGSAALQVATTAGGSIVLGRNDTSVAVDNNIGGIYWDCNDSSGNAWNDVARISCAADGAHADGDYPSRLTFHTTGDGEATVTERLRITNEGYLKYSGTSTADETNKLGRFIMPSHDTGEEDVLYFQMEQEGTFNQLTLGGGSSSYNAATKIIFRTAAVDTVTGTSQLEIDSTGLVDFKENTVQKAVLKNYTETLKAIGDTGTSATLDLADGNVFTATLTGNCTFTFTTGTNSAPNMQSFSLILSNDSTPSRTIAWPASVKWPNNSAPSRTTAASKTDIWSFMSPDNGTTWYGNIALYNFT